MADIPLLASVQSWYCPNCGLHDQTKGIAPGAGGGMARMHPCPRLRGVLAPLLLEGVRAKVELREREDYVGNEQVQVDPERRRPVMSVITTRDNGQDAIVFAPTAVLHAR